MSQTKPFRPEWSETPPRDRTYRASDPEGHIWTFGVTVNQLSPAEWDKASGGSLKTRDRL